MFNPIEGTGTGFSFDNLTPYWLNWAHKLPWMFTIIIQMFENLQVRYGMTSSGIQLVSLTLICITV